MAEYSGFKLRILHGSRVGAYKLAQRDYSIGRAVSGGSQEAGRILLDDATVSRLHAELIWDPKTKAFSLVHKSTTNATLIDGVGLKLDRPKKLRVGDQFQMGLVILTLEQTVEASSEATAESVPAVASRDAEVQAMVVTPEPEPSVPGSAVRQRRENLDRVTSEVLSILGNFKAKE
jgi:pSer/pThr/pTyr-binding forkhead associated (FHA) protein